METLKIKNYGGAVSCIEIKKYKILEREKFLLEYLKGKNVLHFGCCDWPYTKERFQKGDLLFLKLENYCKKQIGVDIAVEGINYLKEQNSSFKIYNLNVVKSNDKKELEKIIVKNDIEIILLGEIIEHLTNHYEFMDAVYELVKNTNKNIKIVITTPNFTSIHNFLSALFKREYVHPDHKFWPPIGTLYFTLSNKFHFEKILFYNSKKGD